MPLAAPRRIDAFYWLLTWLAVALHLGRFFDIASAPLLALYQVVLIGSYALMFVAPAWLVSRLVGAFAPKVGAVLAVLLAGLVQIALYGDHLIWQMYGFHLNGFVWNILTTPGGIAALGSSASTERDFALLAGGIVALQGGARLLAHGMARLRLPAPRLVWVLPLFLLATLGERASYSVSHFYGYSPLLESAQRVPFYQPLTMRGLLIKTFGLKQPQQMEVASAKLSGKLNYPQQPLRIQPPAKPLNIVWLVSESWRADTLNPHVMPQTFAFAQQAQHFLNNYSGGNGTRIGMFSQFYSLPANLWFPVLDARVGSPLFDVLQKENYQIKLFTSAHFTYPEFDKTIFVKVPHEQMVEDNKGVQWERDRRNVGNLLDFIDKRDPSKPFMTFLFFESPHANYNFPPESVIEPDYLPDFSYASMDLNRDIKGIHNRYLNAVHHLDSQMARVVDYLKQHDLLDNTIVVMSGDHGEEFMEKGRWGHNSTFVDEQIRTPLVLWVPGRAPHEESLRTSHTDILPTILPLLGVQNPSQDYAVGRSLLDPKPGRFLLCGDWDRLAFLGEEYKLVLPFSSGSFGSMAISHADDSTVSGTDRSSVLQTKLPLIQTEMSSLRRFLAH